MRKDNFQFVILAVLAWGEMAAMPIPRIFKMENKSWFKDLFGRAESTTMTPSAAAQPLVTSGKTEEAPAWWVDYLAQDKMPMWSEMDIGRCPRKDEEIYQPGCYFNHQIGMPIYVERSDIARSRIAEELTKWPQRVLTVYELLSGSRAAKKNGWELWAMRVVLRRTNDELMKYLAKKALGYIDKTLLFDLKVKGMLRVVSPTAPAFVKLARAAAFYASAAMMGPGGADHLKANETFDLDEQPSGYVMTPFIGEPIEGSLPVLQARLKRSVLVDPVNIPPEGAQSTPSPPTEPHRLDENDRWSMTTQEARDESSALGPNQGRGVLSKAETADREYDAYDCSQPSDLKIVRPPESHKCDKSTNVKILSEEKKEYLILQETPSTESTAWQCRLRRTSLPMFCGHYDHQTLLTNSVQISEPLLLSEEHCRKIVSTKQYTVRVQPGDDEYYDKDFEVTLNTVNRVKYHAFGKTTVEYDEVECEGAHGFQHRDPKTDEVTILKDMVVLHVDELEVTEVKILVTPSGTVTLLDEEQVLPESCSFGQGGCARRRGTWFWAQLTEDAKCRMFQTRKATGLEFEAGTVDGKKIIFVDDTRQVRLERKAKTTRCGRTVYKTNYEEIFLAEVLDAPEVFYRLVPSREMKWDIFVKVQADWMDNDLKTGMMQYAGQVSIMLCEIEKREEIKRFSLLSAQQAAAERGGVIPLGLGRFARASGEAWHVFRCRPVIVLGEDKKECYSALPVQLGRQDRKRRVRIEEAQQQHLLRMGLHQEQMVPLSELQFFMEPLTHQIITDAHRVACVPHMPRYYQNRLGGWTAVSPGIHAAATPNVMEKVSLSLGQWHLKNPDFATGGLYTTEDLRRMHEENQMTHKKRHFIDFMTTNDPGHWVKDNYRKEQIYTNGLDVTGIWTWVKKLRDFLHAYGYTFSIIVGIYSLYSCVYGIIKFIQNFLFAPAHLSKLRKLAFALCPSLSTVALVLCKGHEPPINPGGGGGRGQGRLPLDGHHGWERRNPRRRPDETEERDRPDGGRRSPPLEWLRDEGEWAATRERLEGALMEPSAPYDDNERSIVTRPLMSPAGRTGAVTKHGGGHPLQERVEVKRTVIPFETAPSAREDSLERETLLPAGYHCSPVAARKAVAVLGLGKNDDDIPQASPSIVRTGRGAKETSKLQMKLRRCARILRRIPPPVLPTGRELGGETVHQLGLEHRRPEGNSASDGEQALRVAAWQAGHDQLRSVQKVESRYQQTSRLHVDRVGREEAAGEAEATPPPVSAGCVTYDFLHPRNFDPDVKRGEEEKSVRRDGHAAPPAALEEEERAGHSESLLAKLNVLAKMQPPMTHSAAPSPAASPRVRKRRASIHSRAPETGRIADLPAASAFHRTPLADHPTLLFADPVEGQMSVVYSSTPSAVAADEAAARLGHLQKNDRPGWDNASGLPY